MVQFTVPTIACDACVQAITKSIQERDADAKVVVDLGVKSVEVFASLSPEELEEAIRAAGHEIV